MYINDVVFFFVQALNNNQYNDVGSGKNEKERGFAINTNVIFIIYFLFIKRKQTKMCCGLWEYTCMNTQN